MLTESVGNRGHFTGGVVEKACLNTLRLAL